MAVRKVEARRTRHARVRRKIAGTAARPRLAVFRSNKHTYAQLIDDVTGRTLVAASTLEPEAGGDGKTGPAKSVGKLLADRAKASGIGAAVFDRGGFAYHGRVREVAEGAREAGLSL
ncbi:MAG TPA: 50S ribosomal protein L18 [Actinomycetota bacterium]